jgi:Na+/proline symporter
VVRLGQKRTTSFESYAVGDRAMHPFVAGMALAASTAVALAWRVAGLRRAARAPTAAPPAEP